MATTRQVSDWNCVSDSLNRESLGRVVRIDDLGHGRRGIAVEILMPVYLGGKETLK